MAMQEPVARSVTLHISLRDFVATGRFGPVNIGMHKDDVKRHLGEPNLRNDEPAIWKYGGFEVYFANKGDGADQGTVYQMFIDDFDSPVEWLDLWIFHPMLTIAKAKSILERENICYHEADVPYLADSYYLVTDAGVYLHFSNYVYPFEEKKKGEPVFVAANICIYQLTDEGRPFWALQEPSLSAQKDSAADEA